MQNSYILLSFFGVTAAALGGGLAGWLGAALVALVLRLERRILALTHMGEDQTPSHAVLPGARGSRAH